MKIHPSAVRPKKELGQNFLRNTEILSKIAQSGKIEGKNIVEVGPGLGDLTEVILQHHPKSLTVVELDQAMIEALQKRFGDNTITIINHDILQYDITHLDSYSVYGNIPYYITSPIIFHLLYTVTRAPEAITLTMQKEVADRILARDGVHSVLSVACALVTDIKKGIDIHPNNFFPVPKVWSTVLHFTLKNVDRNVMKNVVELVKLGFSQKRKKCLSNLAGRYDKKVLEQTFDEAGIKRDIRAEKIEPAMWVELYGKLHEKS